AGVIEGVAKFDEHVERHEQAKNILPASIVNQRFDNDESTAGRQRVVCGADEVHLFLKIPVVQDHAHGNDVGFGQRIGEEIAGGGGNGVAETGGGNVFLRDGLDGRKVERDTAQMRILSCGFDGEQTGGATNVTKRFEL